MLYKTLVHKLLLSLSIIIFVLSITKNLIALIIITIFFCCCSFYCKAQDVQIQHKYYTLDDGLPSRTINYITQDSTGFIWLETAKGIARFDGYNFISYTQDNGLRSNDIKSVHCISKNLLWIVYNNRSEEHTSELQSH